MSLRRYDLNLLPILNALLRHRSVTKAGEEIGLTQSATSHALLRLRELFSDPLMVSSGRQMLLTRRAELLFEHLQTSMAAIEQLFNPETFDPLTTERRFRISTSDYVAVLILPHVIRQLRDNAPNISVQVSWDALDVPAKLQANRLDFAFLPRAMLAGNELRSENLYTDDLVVIAATNHPHIGNRISLDTFLTTPHAYFRRDNAPGKGFAESQLQKNGISLQNALIVPDFLTLAFLIAETDYISLIHRKFAEKVRPLLGIKILEPPFPTQKFYLDAWWSIKEDRNAGHQWFLAHVQASVQEVMATKVDTAGSKKGHRKAR